MKDCIFCKIVNGDIPSKTVYEDDLVKVFLDINPVSNGHMLIVPKEHKDTFLDVSDDLLLHINKIAAKMSSLCMEKLDIDGIKLVNNYGSFQEVKHYHLHIIPGKKDIVEELIDTDIILEKLTK